MDASERIAHVRHLRAQVGVNARLRLELHAAVSKLLREHEIEIEGEEVLSYLTLADEEEFAAYHPHVGIPSTAPHVGIPSTAPHVGIPSTAPRVGIPSTAPRPRPGSGTEPK